MHPSGASSTTANRRSRGNRCEALAAAYLARQGFCLLERQFRTRAGEIDLIAQEGGTLCFIEVRSKSGGRFGTAAESVTPHKQRRLALVAQQYLQSRPRLQRAVCRFDVVTLDASADAAPPTIVLLRNAFSPDGRYLY